MRYEATLWRNEFLQHTFQFEDRKAIVVFPHDENKTGKWLLKTEYFSAFQDLEYEMVKRGYHLVYLENHSRWVKPGDLEAKVRFRDFLKEKYGLDDKGILVGMSCGGLHAIKQAAKFPEIVKAVYLDAPVVNLLSCPFGMGVGSNLGEAGRVQALTHLNMTMSDVIAYRDHPLDHLPRLISLRIPALLVYGGSDDIVPFEENGLSIKEAYEKTDIPFLCISKPDCGHHPHGPEEKDMGKAVAFLEGLQ